MDLVLKNDQEYSMKEIFQMLMRSMDKLDDYMDEHITDYGRLIHIDNMDELGDVLEAAMHADAICMILEDDHRQVPTAVSDYVRSSKEFAEAAINVISNYYVEKGIPFPWHQQ